MRDAELRQPDAFAPALVLLAVRGVSRTDAIAYGRDLE
jgi:hypothetical protein